MSETSRGMPATKSPWIEAKAAWRQHQAQTAEPDLRIGIAASFTANTLLQFVGAYLLSAGFKPAFSLGPYNQLFQVCLDPTSHLSADCDAIALLWRIEDLMTEDLEKFLHGDDSALNAAAGKLADFTAAVIRLRAAYPGMIIVSIPPMPSATAIGPLALDHTSRMGAFHRAVVGRLAESVKGIEGIRLVDFDAIQRVIGYDRAFDARQWYLYRQPFSDAFLHAAGVQIGRIVAAARRSAKKCIVLDCDNTLWGGIIGEDGLDGIGLGDEFPGSAFRDLQKLLLYWRQQGIFLALASKNNEADVWEVFDRHDGMVLKRTDISAWQINWQPKGENIALIAKALNIGIDSLVFIDDNPMEIEYMRQAQPDVTSILLPEDPADMVAALQGLMLFDRLDVTQEDRARVDMMRAEIDREALSVNMSKEDFQRTLQLKFELFLGQPDDLGRMTQLTNKTNQFNLTTIRRTLEDVRALAKSSDYRVYGLRVSDKFGEYGLTGVVIIKISADRRVWTIDTLLLSCRVLGRGVEAGLLAALADDARAAGAVEFVGSFIPTKKNALASTFLPDHGFKAAPTGEWRLPVAEVPLLPPYVERIAEAGDTTRAA